MQRIRKASSARRRRRGISFVELLIAGLLLSIGLMAIVQVWTYSFFVTASADDSAIAYNLGRQAIERVRSTGFSAAAEGDSFSYYSGNQVLQSSSGTSRYMVRTNVYSDVMLSGTSGQSGGVPAVYALRRVIVTVRLTASNTVLHQTRTYLVRSGI